MVKRFKTLLVRSKLVSTKGYRIFYDIEDDDGEDDISWGGLRRSTADAFVHRLRGVKGYKLRRKAVTEDEIRRDIEELEYHMKGKAIGKYNLFH